MDVVHVRLLGKLDVRRGEHVPIDLQARKVQELLVYLLLYRERAHAREVLANLLWPESSGSQARKYLRHCLWQLQTALDSSGLSEGRDIVLAEQKWIQVNPEAALWLDVAEFERGYDLAQGPPGQTTDGRRECDVLDGTLALYRGDLLEGWYQDWCLFERERLQHLYLALLERRMIYCEIYGEHELGLRCGTRALRCDVAHERIHRRMMRLHCLAGDRTGALRQYERCVTFLREELGVEPSALTVALCEQIRSDLPLTPAMVLFDDSAFPEREPVVLSETLSQLKQLQMAFTETLRQLQDTIQVVEVNLDRQY